MFRVGGLRNLLGEEDCPFADRKAVEKKSLLLRGQGPGCEESVKEGGGSL